MKINLKSKFHEWDNILSTFYSQIIMFTLGPMAHGTLVIHTP
jgi:hypothetical protein